MSVLVDFLWLLNTVTWPYGARDQRSSEARHPAAPAMPYFSGVSRESLSPGFFFLDATLTSKLCTLKQTTTATLADPSPQQKR